MLLERTGLRTSNGHQNYESGSLSRPALVSRLGSLPTWISLTGNDLLMLPGCYRSQPTLHDIT